ncbi:MAG: hypothetical protein KJ939_07880, partial [Nanoarchaeota archaeon]|nr:hypothetical protein [Nanoarchaeota archaeon]
MKAYFEPNVKIKDIVAKVDEIETTGIETTEKSINITVKVDNTLTAEYNINVTLNITSSSNAVIYSGQQNFTITASTNMEVNFTDINTTDWTQGDYVMKAYISEDKQDSRFESLIFKNVQIEVEAAPYMCNGTSDYYNVTIYHPFNDTIKYNVTLQMPAGWTYSGMQKVNITNLGNYTLRFNITSDQTPINATIKAFVNYSYPYVAKNRNQTDNVEMSNAIPIIEVIRETPKVMGNNKVFDSIISLHNKGCAATTGTTIITEDVLEGWTPANPSLRGDVTLISASSDLINNKLMWQLGTIGINNYAILTYQVKSPAGYPQTGTLQYNVSWGVKNLPEKKQFIVQTFNYSSESHIEFDLTIVQQSDNYPWPEPRSAQVGKIYNYSLEAKNIGDTVASGWNVTVKIPTDCNVSNIYNEGVWHPSNRKIEWNLSVLSVYASAYFNFTLNCSTHGKQVLEAEAVKNTSQETSYLNETSIGCTGANCETQQQYTFSQPENVRYGRLREVDFYIYKNWTAQGLTIGQGKINFTNDVSETFNVWQEATFENKGERKWINYSISEEKRGEFVNSERNIVVGAYADGTYGNSANVTIEKIAYIWEHGKYFQETQNLFVKIKEYEYFPLYDNFTLLIDNNNTKTIGGWGESYNFTVLVKDRFARNVTVFAWHKKGAAAYTQINNWTCEDCGAWTQANFSYVYNGTDIGSWKVKANFTNFDGPSETSETEYTVEADDTNADYSFPAYDFMVNRSQTTNFTINIYDRDNQSTPGYLVEGAIDEGKGRIYISKFNSNETFDSVAISANESGSLIRSMTNTSLQWCKTTEYYLGRNYWSGGVTGATTYKNNLTIMRPFTLMGDLYNTYIEPKNVNYTLRSVIPLEGTIIDDCGVNRNDASVNFTLVNGAYINSQKVTYNTPTASYK